MSPKEQDDFLLPPTPLGPFPQMTVLLVNPAAHMGPCASHRSLLLSYKQGSMNSHHGLWAGRRV